MFLNINLAAAATPVSAAAASAASAGSSLVALSRSSFSGLSTTVLSKGPTFGTLAVDLYTLPLLFSLAALLSLLVRRTLPFHLTLRLPKSMPHVNVPVADKPLDAAWFASATPYALPLPPSPTSPVTSFSAGSKVPPPLQLGRIANTQPADQPVQFVWSNPRARAATLTSPSSPSIPIVYTPQPPLSMAKLIMTRHSTRKPVRQSHRRSSSSPPPSPPYQQMGFGAKNPLSPA